MPGSSLGVTGLAGRSDMKDKGRKEGREGGENKGREEGR